MRRIKNRSEISFKPVCLGILFVVISSFLIPFAQASSPGSQMQFPTTSWVQVPAASQGVDPFKLEQATQFLASRSGTDGISELVVIRNGYLIWKGQNTDRVHHTWSIGKVFTSTVLGLLSDDKTCTPETPVKNILPGLAHQYPELQLKHLTTMTSGYDASGGAAWGDLLDGSNTPWLPAEPLFKPGAAYLYWDDAANLMAHALTQAAQESMFSLFKRRIADPIGIAPDRWGWDSWGIVDGYSLNQGSMGVRISAVELARLGHLYLNRGKWNEKQLLSETWVDSATQNKVPATLPLYLDLNPEPENYTAHMDADGRGIYGFHWWVNGITPDGLRHLPDAPATTFFSAGFNHNMLFVIPDWNMVIVRLGLDGTIANADETWNQFLKKIGDSLVDYYPAKVESFTLLDAETGQELGPLRDGDIINLADLPDSDFNIRADTVPPTVGSVAFKLDGIAPETLDNTRSYTLNSVDATRSLYPWPPVPGLHTLTATPFAQVEAGGPSGEALSIRFSLVEDYGNLSPSADAGPDQVLVDSDGDGVEMAQLDGSASTGHGSIRSYYWFLGNSFIASGAESSVALPRGRHTLILYVVDSQNKILSDQCTVTVTASPQGSLLPTPAPVPVPAPPPTSRIVGFTLVNAQTGAHIAQLHDGDIINLSDLNSAPLNIRAETSPAIVGSVRFGLDADPDFSIENISPYALAGDDQGNYHAWPVSLGHHSLTATPYSDTRGGGTAGQPLTVTFEVTRSFAPPKDLLSLHYDHAPDKDDGQSAAADRTLLQELFGLEWIRDHVVPVSGAYGLNKSEFNPASDAVMDAAWNDCGGWLAAHTERAAALAKLTLQWGETLQSGGDVWVKEGGQSDLTAEVLKRIKEEMPEIDTRLRIHVVQHSRWNENHTTAADLEYTIEHSDYIRIKDANAYLNAARGDTAFVEAASNHPAYGPIWRAAFAYYNPDERLDFSDTGELLNILGLGEMGFDEFRERFLSVD